MAREHSASRLSWVKSVVCWDWGWGLADARWPLLRTGCDLPFVIDTRFRVVVAF